MALEKFDILALGRGNLTDNSNAAIVFSSNNIVALWLNPTTYAQYNVVEYSGKVYRSKIAGNVGNQPDISPGQWETMYSGVKDGDVAIVVNGAQSTTLQRRAGVWVNSADAYTTVALVDGQATLTDVFSFIGNAMTVAEVKYVLKRGVTPGRFRRGSFNVLNNTSSDVQHDHEFSSQGIDINAYLTWVWGGSSVHLQYTSGGTGVGTPEGIPLQISYLIKGITP